jgi:hypothetical protein
MIYIKDKKRWLTYTVLTYGNLYTHVVKVIFEFILFLKVLKLSHVLVASSREFQTTAPL